METGLLCQVALNHSAMWSRISQSRCWTWSWRLLEPPPLPCHTLKAATSPGKWRKDLDRGCSQTYDSVRSHCKCQRIKRLQGLFSEKQHDMFEKIQVCWCWTAEGWTPLLSVRNLSACGQRCRRNRHPAVVTVQERTRGWKPLSPNTGSTTWNPLSANWIELCHLSKCLESENHLFWYLYRCLP